MHGDPGQEAIRGDQRLEAKVGDREPVALTDLVLEAILGVWVLEAIVGVWVLEAIVGVWVLEAILSVWVHEAILGVWVGPAAAVRVTLAAVTTRSHFQLGATVSSRAPKEADIVRLMRRLMHMLMRKTTSALPVLSGVLFPPGKGPCLRAATAAFCPPCELCSNWILSAIAR